MIRVTCGRKEVDLPPSESITITADKTKIVEALSAIIPHGDYYRHVEVMQNTARSGRIIFPRSTSVSVSLGTFLSPADVYIELIGKFSCEARYDPQENPSSLYEKGWEIRKIEIEGVIGALIWATWIRKLAS